MLGCGCRTHVDLPYVVGARIADSLGTGQTWKLVCAMGSVSGLKGCGWKAPVAFSAIDSELNVMADESLARPAQHRGAVVSMPARPGASGAWEAWLDERALARHYGV